METLVINSEIIVATDFSMEATILTLNTTPTKEEAKELFNNDSVILEF